MHRLPKPTDLNSVGYVRRARDSPHQYTLRPPQTRQEIGGFLARGGEPSVQHNSGPDGRIAAQVHRRRGRLPPRPRRDRRAQRGRPRARASGLYRRPPSVDVTCQMENWCSRSGPGHGRECRSSRVACRRARTNMASPQITASSTAQPAGRLPIPCFSTPSHVSSAPAR